jgi:hypothetical protein
VAFTAASTQVLFQACFAINSFCVAVPCRRMAKDTAQITHTVVDLIFVLALRSWGRELLNGNHAV